MPIYLFILNEHAKIVKFIVLTDNLKSFLFYM